MIANAFTDLHAELTPILRYAFARMHLPRQGIVLDLAGGPGHKLPLLAETCGPGVDIMVLDVEREAVRSACSGAYAAWGVVGDAQALPLRDAACAAVVCIAALGLLTDQVAALRDMRRVVSDAGSVVLATATQAWARINRWPAQQAENLSRAYAQALAQGCPIPHAAPDLSTELHALLLQAGYVAPMLLAFLLEADLHPIQAEIALLPWEYLRELTAPHLGAAELQLCDTCAAMDDIELCSYTLIAHMTPAR